MRESLTAASKAAELRMRRSLHRRAMMVVEGDSDARVYRRVIDHRSIVIANNREQALAVRRLLLDEPAILAVVDADFDRLEGTAPSEPDVFLTDHRDLETMAFAAGAARKVVEVRGSHDKLDRLDGTVLAVLLPAALAVGRLRWHSHRSESALRFRGLKFNKQWLDERTLTPDPYKLARAVCDLSRRPGLEARALSDAAERLTAEQADPLDVCCGHDLAAVLGLALRKRLGSLNAGETSTERMEENILLAWDDADIRATRLYRDLVQWSSAHPDWPLLRAA